MGMQLGMLLNFMHTTSILVDHAGADLWITAHGVRTVDLATPLEERRRFQALKVDGVEAAEPYLLGFGYWKRADGVREMVIIVGINPDATMGKPWDLLDGVNAREAMLSPDGVIVDRLYAEKLSVNAAGQLFEINDHRVRVAGFTSASGRSRSLHIFSPRSAMREPSLSVRSTIPLLMCWSCRRGPLARGRCPETFGELARRGRPYRA